jgi:carboxypeptidase C (cathepsin A)
MLYTHLSVSTATVSSSDHRKCRSLIHIAARSFLPTLGKVVQSGVTTVIWAGDADAVCDWFGGFASANEIPFSGHPAFKKKAVKDYKVGGVVGGTFKTVENLSWLRVFASGHEVPAFKPELAFQVFKQTMQKKAIYST